MNAAERKKQEEMGAKVKKLLNEAKARGNTEISLPRICPHLCTSTTAPTPRGTYSCTYAVRAVYTPRSRLRRCGRRTSSGPSSASTSPRSRREIEIPSLTLALSLHLLPPAEIILDIHRDYHDLHPCPRTPCPGGLPHGHDRGAPAGGRRPRADAGGEPVGDERGHAQVRAADTRIYGYGHPRRCALFRVLRAVARLLCVSAVGWVVAGGCLLSISCIHPAYPCVCPYPCPHRRLSSVMAEGAMSEKEKKRRAVVHKARRVGRENLEKNSLMDTDHEWGHRRNGNDTI